MRVLRLIRPVLVAATLATLAAFSPAVGASPPSATTATSIRAVGPLFFPSVLGLGPALGLPHYCSASVVHSTRGDLILTAAHCVYGSGLGIEFAPGFHDGVAPYGIWSVRRAYVDAQWRRGHDPQHDVAVLAVAARHGTTVEQRTGANRLAAAPAAGTAVTVDGYVAGSGGRPITCTALVYYTDGFPSFDCAGYEDGVSGGPWLVGNRVVGVTGGRQQGGCTPDTSYSPAFGAATSALLARAERGGPGDFMTPPGTGGC